MSVDDDSFDPDVTRIVTPNSNKEDLASSETANLLPIGTRLGEFEITGIIGEGGFGIVYGAYDHQLERDIAIKEYMPSALAARTQVTQVAVKSERHRETFDIGLRSFINEAKLLAQFDHPALVKVYRFWEANGTAYMVMPYYRGKTLRSVLNELNAPPDEDWMQQFLGPLCDALETIHEQNCFHRDIAPDNIMILPNGSPLLLDFGAARRVISDMTQALTVILKPGYAPMEQYANGPEMRQGPWTDVYALAAVIYYCITGKAPVPSVSRLMKDTMKPAIEVGEGVYSEQFLHAIDRALTVSIDNRTASIAEFRQELGIGRDESPTAAVTGLPISAGISAQNAGASQHTRTGPKHTATKSPDDPIKPDKNRRENPDGSKSKTIIMLVGFGLAGMLGALAWYLTPSSDQSSKSKVPSLQSTQPASPVLSAPRDPVFSPPVTSAKPEVQTPPLQPKELSPQANASSTDNRTSATVAPSRPGESMAKSPSSETAIVAPMSTPDRTAANPPTHDQKSLQTAPPRTSVTESSIAQYRDRISIRSMMTEVINLRDPNWRLETAPDSNSVRIDKDHLRFKVRSSRSGYVYVLMMGTDSSHFYQLFPNALDGRNRISANVEMSLPRDNWSMVAGGPPGVNRFLILVTPSQRSFESVGLVRGEPFSEFDLAVTERVVATEGAVALTGTITGCKLPPNECSAFGANTFEIRELQ